MSVAAANAPPTLLFQDAQGAPLAGVISRMDDHQISISAQNRLLALLAPMHAEIVNR